MKKEPIRINKISEDAVIPDIEKIESTPIFQEIEKRVTTFFNNNDKFYDWLYIKNPMLGNVTPMEMLVLGREEKLLKFVKDSLAENKR